MNEYEITHTPKNGLVNEPPVDMNPKHDRGLCAICQTHNCWNCWNNPHNQISKTYHRDNLKKGKTMKRTCKTCAAHDQWCWRAKDDCPDNKPACEDWILSADKLTKAMCASLDKAREKHPVFLDVWPKAEDVECYLDAAKAWKKRIEHKGSSQLHAILFSEACEFLAEIARGDFDRALEEAGDVVAVLYRALNGDGKQEESK